MSDPFLDSTRNLARWLQEAGHRKKAPVPAADPAPQAAPPPASRRSLSFVRGMSSGRWLALAAVTVLAYLQYFFADTMLQISALPYVVCFLPVN